MECRICGNSEGNTTYKVREMMMGLREEFSYYQCSRCKCLQITEIPDNISKYYSRDYYSFQSNESPHWVMKIIKDKRNQYAVFNRSFIGKLLYKKYPKEDLRSLSHLDLNKNTKILDVGCGRGRLLRALHRLGFKNLTGIDPFIKEEVVKIGGNSKIFKKRLHQLEGQWDLIMMHHVFEHMPDPEYVLGNLSRLLSTGGDCLIRIPVTQSKAWKKFRENWVQLDPPRHYFIHSPKSIEHLFSESDLELTKVIYDSTSFQFWGSIQYENNIPLQDEKSYALNPQKSIFTSQDIKNFSLKAKVLNREKKGDQAIFLFKKKTS